MTAPTAVDRLIDALDQMHNTAKAAGQQPAWPPPRQQAWAHMPIVLHDLVWNLGRNYDTVTGKVIGRYADHIAATSRHTRDGLLADVDVTLAERFDPHSTGEGLAALEQLGAPGRLQLAANRSPAHARPGAPRRAETVLDAHRAFTAIDVDTVLDAQALLDSATGMVTLRRTITSVPGLDKAAVAYFPLLVGRESIKPDRHVINWFANLGIAAGDIRPITYTAVEQLNARDGGGWTVGGIDHAIWRTQSGRPLRAT